MPALGKDFALATQYIRNLRGGSQPILVQASDGLLYVVKFTNNLQGPNVPFNESIGTELYRACGLPVPSWKPVMVTNSFLDRNPECWMETPEGRLRPESGLCFGSRFLGGDGVRLLEILPGTSFGRVRNRKNFWLAWLIDICTKHVDNRQAVFVENADRSLEASFIDMGHMFGGPEANQAKHFRASRYLDSRIYPEVTLEELREFRSVVGVLDVDRLWQRVRAIPADWSRASALDCFVRSLQALSDHRLVHNILESILDAHRRRTERAFGDHLWEEKVPVEVLRLGVQGSELEWIRSGKRVRNPACA